MSHEGSFADFVAWQRTADLKKPTCTTEELAALPVSTPNRAVLDHPQPGKIQVTWLGHASCLVQLDGWNVLSDPIFSERCSPVQFAGPKRVVASPVQAEDLPRIDVIIISHTHYDHLDCSSVLQLAKLRPAPMWFVPLGTKEWFLRQGVVNVVEMDWSEEAILEDSNGGGAEAAKLRPDLKLYCLPCQHWCSRTPFDKNACLWSSWLVKTENAKYFFGGDTGYCGGIFKKVGQLHGPVDISAIPIGAYGDPRERWFHEIRSI